MLNTCGCCKSWTEATKKILIILSDYKNNETIEIYKIITETIGTDNQEIIKTMVQQFNHYGIIELIGTKTDIKKDKYSVCSLVVEEWYWG